MRASRFSLLGTIVVLVPLLKTTIAHHSTAAVYDNTRVLTVTGVVTQFKFVNPHAFMFMEVTDPSGKVDKWAVEFAGKLNLTEVGWTADSIKAKERVTVTGNPSRAGDAHQIVFLKLVKADGTELLPSNAQRLNDIEEQRRKQRLARDGQK